jgi:predicted MFS family arabinose efflux permease
MPAVTLPGIPDDDATSRSASPSRPDRSGGGPTCRHRPTVQVVEARRLARRVICTPRPALSCPWGLNGTRRAMSKAVAAYDPGMSLDWLNFLLADVRGGLGPYVGVYLITQAGWDQATLGAILTASGLVGISVHAPLGAYIDATRAKRGVLVAAVVALSLASVSLAIAPQLPVVLAADVTMAVLGGVFAPVVAALTMGLVARAALARRFGRNAALDKLGNIFVAVAAAFIGWAFGMQAIFWSVPLFGLLAIAATLSIPASAIDHERARALTEQAFEKHPTRAAAIAPAPEAWWRLLLRRDVRNLALIAATFHFANAPMLNMVSQKLALQHPAFASPLTATAVLIAQFSTIPVALLLSRSAKIGLRPFLFFALGALPLRGAIFAMTDSPAILLAAQVLDGVGGGLFDALLPLLLAEFVRGSGRYSLARGSLSTVQGIGGSLSNVVSGGLIVAAGYDVTFAVLATIGLAVVVGTWCALPSLEPHPHA